MPVSRKIKSLLLLGFLIFLLVHNTYALADSVYAIPDHWGPLQATLDVYDILEGDDAGKIYYRETYELKYGGAGDVTIDTQSDMLFVTFEFQDQIQLVNARTFLSEGFVTAEGLDTNTPGLAGIVLDYVDPNAVRLYTIERGTLNFYVYDWDASTKTLTPITPDPNDPDNPNFGENVPYFLLDPNDVNCTGAYGLALDDVNNQLYVTYFNNTVHYFDARSDYFDHLGSVDIGRAAMDIDVDTTNNYLYTGGYSSHTYLVKTWLGDPNDYNTADEENIGEGVIGLAVDRESGYVYCTTYNNQLEVWNPDTPFGLGFSLIDAEPIDAGAGVCVADVDYIPPFDVSKIDDVNDCVIPRAGEEITYTISYWYNWTEEGDPNLYDFTSIYIKDYLPREVDFISADPNPGYYDENSHSYVWSITPETYGDPNSIEITVEINNKVTPGGYIENAVVEIVTDIYGQEYVEKAEVETNICECGDNGVVWYVDAEEEGDGTSWEDAFETIEQALNAAFPCDEIWVAKGTYTPVEEPNLVNYVGCTAASMEMKVSVMKGTGVSGWWSSAAILTVTMI